MGQRPNGVRKPECAFTNGGQYSDPALIHLIFTITARKFHAEKIAKISFRRRNRQ